MNKHKILYVEDEVVVLLEIRKELEAAGYEVTTATNGEKTIKLLEKEAFDLVITDVIMGEIDGFEVVKKAKELCPETITMILTGYGETDFAIKALRIGVDDYILKPYETEDFLFRVKRCLEKSELLSKNKQVNNAFRESEERLRAFMESSPDRFALFDSELNYVEINKAGLKAIGKAKKQIIGKNILDINPTLKGTDRYNKYLEAVKTGKPFFIEDFVPHPRFGDLHLSVSIFKVGAGLGAIVSDITEHKLMEEALREREVRLAAIIDKSPIPTAVGDSDGSITSFNGALEELIGYSQAEISDVSEWADKLYPDKEYRDFVWRNIEQALRGEKQDCNEFTITCKNGSTRKVDFHTSFFENGLVIQMVDITDRKRADEALKESEEKYRIQFDEALDPIIIADAETGIIINCNKAATELVGRAKSELVGKHQRILHPPEEIEGEFNRSFKQHLKEKEGQAIETQVSTENGEIRDVSIKANIFELRGKNVIQGIFRDITERKKMEKELRESEKKYRQLIEALCEGIWMIDKDAYTTFVNSPMAEMLGYTSEEMIGKHLFAFMDEQGEKKGKRNLQRRKQGIIEQHEFEFLRKDGKRIYTILETSPIIDVEGNYAGAIAGVIDITERKQAEEKLRESEERLRLVVQNMPAMMDAIDKNGNISVWNHECERIIGYSADEIIGNPKAWELIYPDADFRKFAKEERPKRGYDYSPREWDMVCKDGNVKTIEWYNISKLFPISSWSSWAIGIDVTKRKRAEEQVKASLKEKEILLQEIHHRVRNNMQVVSSLLKLQAGTMKDEKIQQAFKESQRRVSAMALVHETLYRSKSMAEIGLQKHIPALVDSIYRTFAIKQKVKLHVDIEDIKLSIGQATPLSLVINELISNSLQHAFPEGKGEVSVKLHLRGKDKIEVVIRDNGRGMPEDIDYDKTLGLQLVKGLVESQLGGNWKIKTEAGTKHTIRFKKKEWIGPSRLLNTRSTRH